MIKKLGILAVTMITLFSCGKSTGVIPNVAVNFQADINDPRLSALHSPGGAVIIPGYGVAGLIIYREADMSYAAYDRCSSYQPQNHCAVNLDNNTLTCTDPCSGSKFSLIDGTPVKAPATRSLKAYSVNVSNFEIFVSN
jgi:nitrite reductase/ring-hydroxylating ferredoxin subunit